MTKMNWESRRAETLVRAATGLERRENFLRRQAARAAERAQIAARRAGVRAEPKKAPSREEVCAWLDEVMKSNPDRPWLAV